MGARSAPVNSAWGTVPDFNGDGFADVIVGSASDANVHVYHGSATGLGSGPATRLFESPPGAYFGQSVASAGDVNGDGFGDAIVSGGGAEYIYFGSVSGLPRSASQTIPSGDGLEFGSLIGAPVAAAGDVNADGYGDVLVGNHAADGVRLYYGSATGIGGSPTLIGRPTGAETVVAAGPTSPPASIPPQALAGAASRTGVLQLAVANELCALLGDHTVHCVGLDGSGGARAVQGIGVVTRLVGRESTLCATDTSSHHRCWGQFSGWGGSDVPDGEQPQTLIAVGGDVIPPAEGVNGLGAWPLILTPQGEVRTTGFVGMSDPTSRPEVFPGRVAEADQNPDTVCARLTDGTVYCARGNHPVHVTNIEGARELRLGWDHGCARDEFGRVRCWEICRYGEVEGIGTRACRIFQHLQQRATLRSTEIRLGSPAQGLAELGSTFCALLDTGSVRCWRFGARGAIEMGSRIDGFAHARFLVGFGAEVCAVMEDGTVRCARIDGSSRLQRTVSFGS